MISSWWHLVSWFSPYTLELLIALLVLLLLSVTWKKRVILEPTKGHIVLTQPLRPLLLKLMKTQPSSWGSGETNYKRPFCKGVSKRGLTILSYHLSSEGCWDLHLSRQSPPIATIGISEELLAHERFIFAYIKSSVRSSSSSFPSIILILPSHYGKDRENEDSWAMYYWTRLVNDTSFLSISQWL